MVLAFVDVISHPGCSAVDDTVHTTSVEAQSSSDQTYLAWKSAWQDQICSAMILRRVAYIFC